MCGYYYLLLTIDRRLLLKLKGLQISLRYCLQAVMVSCPDPDWPINGQDPLCNRAQDHGLVM